MFTLTSPTLLLLGVSAIGAIYLTTRKRKRYPPGPSGYPIIGNVLDMPNVDECRTFAGWREKYGDLIFLNLAGTPILITSTYSTSTALLEKKSSIYSNRPEAPMANLVGLQNNLAFLQYGKRFREGRKLFYQEFGNAGGLGKFWGMEEEESLGLLRRLAGAKEKGEGVERVISKHSGALIMRVAYGYNSATEDHTLTALVNKVMKAAALVTAPSHFWVNVLPWLRHLPATLGPLPLATFHRVAQSYKKDLFEMVDRPFDFVKSGMRAGTAPESFTSFLLSELEKEGEQGKLGKGEREEREETIKWLAGTMFSGGADTTHATLLSFLLALTLHPTVQRKAQEEIDRVVGSDRLPTFADRGSLKYVEWLVWEVVRWFSVVPIGIPHVSVADDVHEGYFIPKGTIVFQNIWLMSHDPAVYTNPDEFDPERYAPHRAEQDPREFCFGFGRRACPGKHLAEMTVWIAVVRILHTFHIRPVKGKPLPTVKSAPGLVTHPVDFDCEITIREGREGLVWQD